MTWKVLLTVGPQSLWTEAQVRVGVSVRVYVQQVVQVTVAELVEIHVRDVARVVVDNAAVIVQVAVVLNVQGVLEIVR